MSAEVISVASLVVIFLISSALIVWPSYEDGLVGKVALIVLAFASAAVLLDYDLQHSYLPMKTTAATHLGFAAFMVRHFYRFVRYTMGGKFSWKRDATRDAS